MLELQRYRSPSPTSSKIPTRLSSPPSRSMTSTCRPFTELDLRSRADFVWSPAATLTCSRECTRWASRSLPRSKSAPFLFFSRTRSSSPSLPSAHPAHLPFSQPTEYDRPVAVWNRKDGCFRSHHALARRHGPQAASGAPHYLSSEARADLPTRLQAVCIAPSRELALQIISVVQRMGEYTPVECFHAGRDSVKRGMPKLQQQIVIGTPGTIIDVSGR